MKSIILLLILFVLLGLVLLGGVIAMTWESNDKMTSWTKAVCSDTNFCIDVQITCVNGKVVDIRPVPYGVQHDRVWSDPRSAEFKELWCA